MSAFPVFAKAVQAQLSTLTSNPLIPVFATTATRDELWKAYLAAFPEGTNPIFRVRAEHDCACCRNFVKGIGGIVTVDADGAHQTVWDVIKLPAPYDTVAARMADFIRSHPIEQVYRTREMRYGSPLTVESAAGVGDIEWHHFSCAVPEHLRTPKPAEAVGDFASAFQVLNRGLAELTVDALATVADLIDSNSLYRGEEHRSKVLDFQRMKLAYDALPEDRRATFVWQNVTGYNARFRNMAIGTLVQDISEGMDVERAVARFEAMVAPTNYRRTTAAITPGMITKALETLRSLGLESAVRRRFAEIGDVAVTDVLFVDRSVQPLMRDPLAELLMTGVPARKRPGRDPSVPDVTGEEFMERILPGASSIELVLDHTHLNNLVTLTAPEDPDSARLFTWDSGLAWAYAGDATDSIKERVKAAGGDVEALLRVSLSWSNYDDLDLHCRLPDGTHVYYCFKNNILDVDMNAGQGTTRAPVENLAFKRLQDGVHTVFVQQFSRRENTNVGFDIEYDHRGALRRFRYDRAVTGDVPVMTFTVKGGVVVEVLPAAEMREGSATTERWGLTTGQTVPVDVVMLSPNHWGPIDRRQGNKHHIFVLRGCRNPDPVRGIFNEYLRSEFHPHRKVFEVLGAKTMCQPPEKQLSGVGFSSTRHDRATFVVHKGDSTRTYHVQF